MTKKLILFAVSVFAISMVANGQDANKILKEIDKNIAADTRIIESNMTIHGKRNSRTMRSINYAVGEEKSYSEYLSPAREKGTKMLKIGSEMWIYSPSTDRTVMISGHMLRQSVMGSDLSYEDMMDDRELTEIYTPKIIGKETYDSRQCYVMQLTAKVNNATYQSQKMWVDIERMIPLKQELYAKSGQLLKKITLSNVQKVQGRWYPMKMNYKDVLKEGQGTDWEIISIKFNEKIDEKIFSKASLKK